jgi:hypothetical protein
MTGGAKNRNCRAPGVSERSPDSGSARRELSSGWVVSKFAPTKTRCDFRASPARHSGPPHQQTPPETRQNSEETRGNYRKHVNTNTAKHRTPPNTSSSPAFGGVRLCAPRLPTVSVHGQGGDWSASDAVWNLPKPSTGVPRGTLGYLGFSSGYPKDPVSPVGGRGGSFGVPRGMPRHLEAPRGYPGLPGGSPRYHLRAALE